MPAAPSHITVQLHCIAQSYAQVSQGASAVDEEQGYVGTYLNSDVHLHYRSLLGLTLATSKELRGSCVDPKTNELFSQNQSNLAKGFQCIIVRL